MKVDVDKTDYKHYLLNKISFFRIYLARIRFILDYTAVSIADNSFEKNPEEKQTTVLP